MKALLLTIALLTFQAQAQDLKMLTIQTDVDTTQTGIMHLRVLSDTTFTHVVYGLENDSEAPKAIAVDKLNKSKVSILKKGPVAVVELSAKSTTNNDMILSVHYLYKYSIFGSDRRVKKVQMYYLSPANMYETRDMDTQKVITNAYAYARYDSSGDPAGIERIETW